MIKHRPGCTGSSVPFDTSFEKKKINRTRKQSETQLSFSHGALIWYYCCDATQFRTDVTCAISNGRHLRRRDRASSPVVPASPFSDRPSSQRRIHRHHRSRPGHGSPTEAHRTCKHYHKSMSIVTSSYQFSIQTNISCRVQ